MDHKNSQSASYAAAGVDITHERCEAHHVPYMSLYTNHSQRYRNIHRPDSNT